MRRGSWGPVVGATLVAALLVLPGTPGAAGASAPGHHRVARPAAPATTAPTAPMAPTARRLPHDDDAVQPRSHPGLRPPPDARGGVLVPAHLHLLVARFHVGGTPKVPSTSQMTAVTKQTARWFHTVSRGRQSVAYQVTPWLSFPGSLSALCNNVGDVGTMVRKLSAAGLHPAAYNRLMFVMPQCGTSSLGEIRGSITWIREPMPALATLVHELGHNLGLEHAYSLICAEGKMRVTLAGKCYPQEYGDLWDAMGISVRPYSVAILERLGWAGRVATPRGSGTFTLADAEHSGSKLQALHVVINSHRSYWLEFHPETLADSTPPPIKGTPGVQIRLDTGGPSLRVLDAAPGNPDPFLSFPDPDLARLTMPVRTSFTTPEHVRITLLKQGATSARVKVQRGLNATRPGRPTLRGVLNVFPQGQDDLYVAPGTDGGQLILGYQVTAHPSGRTTFIPRIGGTGVLQLYQHFGSSYDVRSVTQQGSSPPSAAAAPEPAGPAITGVTPAEGSSLPGHRVDLGVNAEPNRLTGSPVTLVSTCEVVGGSCIGNSDRQDGSAPFSLSYAALPAGSYAFRVTARDAAGNETNVVRHLVVAGYPPSLTVTAPIAGATLTRNFHVTGTASTTTPGSLAVPSVYVELLDASGSPVQDGTATTASFDIAFTDVPRGTFTLRVTANDPADYSDVTVVRRTVTVAETRPIVTVTSPQPGTSLDAREHAVQLGVDHPERLTGATADLYVDGQYQSSVYFDPAPYVGSIYLDTFTPGTTHQLTVTVNDGYFGTWDLPAVSFTVIARQEPTVSIVTPAENAALTGGTTDLTLSISHPERFDPYWYAEIYVDGALNNYVDVSQSPYTTPVYLSGLSTGSHQLTVKVYDSSYASWTVGPRAFTYTP